MGVMEIRRAMVAAQDQFIPPEYQRYDYLMQQGHKSHIDTGVPGNDETLEIYASYKPLIVSSYFGFCGNYVNENTACWRIIQSTTSYPRTYIVNCGSKKAGSSNSIQGSTSETNSKLNIRADFHLTYTSASVKCSDGYTQTMSITPDSSPRSSTNIALGANSVGSTSFSTSVNGNIYSFKMKSHGNLIRNYVPVVRKSDSKAGFYDTVNHTFNPSIGSAEFVAGND